MASPAISGWAKALVLPLSLLAVAELAAWGSGTQSDSLAPPSAVAVALAGALIDGSIAEASRDLLFKYFG